MKLKGKWTLSNLNDHSFLQWLLDCFTIYLKKWQEVMENGNNYSSEKTWTYILLRYQMHIKPGKSGDFSKEVKEVIINSSIILFIDIGISDFPHKPILECLLPFNTFKGISTLIKRDFILWTETLLPTLEIKIIIKLNWNNRLHKIYFFSCY